MKYKLAIFDFDGTLANTFPWLLSILDQLADQHGFERLDSSQIETLRGLDARTILKKYHLPAWKMAMIGRQVRSMMTRDIHSLKLFDGMDQVLHALDQSGMLLAVVSSNSLENVRQVLGPENVARFGYFECGVNLFGKHVKFQKILGRSGIRPSEAICIGDEIRDIEAAREVRAAAGAVSWGYAKAEALQEQSPDMTFSHVDEIVEKLT